ncbi:hypothetical protein N9P38_00150 [Flavobacteriales bacterium]|nr:hypothetical protein [Flavobacteriales bacterium]MDB4088328.1 hypothetical protein [Flavobacteriales bacterium]
MKKVILLLFLYSSVFSQGPIDGYMKNKKQFAFGLSYSFEKASKLYAGENLIGVTRTTNAYSFFGTYGITDKLNVQVGLPYLNVNIGARKGFQDASAYLKYQILKKDNKYGNINLIAASGIILPTSDYELGGAHALGQHSVAGDFRAVVQQNFKNKFFAALQSGYYLKEQPTPNGFSSALKIGYAGKIYADIWFEFLEALGGTDYLGAGALDPSSSGGFPSLGFGYKKIGGTVFYPFTKHIGGFAGFSYVLAGRNAFKNTVANIGIVIQ